MKSKSATEHTVRANRAVLETLPRDDGGDFADARRGLLAPLDAAPILSDGATAWDFARFAEFEGESEPCPDTVHPALWRQAQLNAIGGLFEVCPGVYQVRGLDLSNVTLIEGRRGRIVVDPLVSAECAEAALALAARHLGDRPVSAMIYTHSHADHFGGSEAVSRLAADEFEIVAPEGFLEHAISENILAGNVMRRRAAYMYGSLLSAGERGIVDSGLGKTTSSGHVGLVPPTRTIGEDGEQITIDGVDFVFHLVPDTEAPAAMMFYLPAHRVLNVADTAVASQHNLYTPRGAQVRDATIWSAALDQTARRFGPISDVLIGGHNWPRFGAPAIVEYLEVQRDLYKYVHDQTLRLMNAGHTPREISEELALPKSLAKYWYVRDYYGTVSHNAKAVYQRYIGWFDGHPGSLHALPPTESGPRYVEFMGGPNALLAKARSAFDAGDYRFVAEVLTHLVFADPQNAAARDLQADALEQLGYQSESGPWRNFYLTGAQELRDAKTSTERAALRLPSALGDRIAVSQIFDVLSVSLDPKRAEGLTASIDWNFTDGGGRYLMLVRHSVTQYRTYAGEPVDVHLNLTRKTLIALLSRKQQFHELVASKDLEIEGDLAPFVKLLLALERPDPNFPIVTP